MIGLVIYPRISQMFANLIPSSNNNHSHQKKVLKSMNLVSLVKIFFVMVIAYCLVYVALSLNGKYQRMDFSGLYNGRIKSTSELWWAPFGFYDENISPTGSVAAEKGMVIGCWRYGLIRAFHPLWYMDIHFFHKWKVE